ncbi:MAG: hypothetical protein IPK60_04375 [Sandaracinaceae bacterium]|nr:hypothetical protein [Sandaracinaceae bacterium]
MSKRSILLSLCTLAGFGALTVAPGCGSSSEVANQETLSGSRGDATVREQCNPDNGEVRSVDVNGDGTPDLRHVFQNGVERCAILDMNYDGRVDITRFFGPDGRTVIREEDDYDFDGRMDEIRYFENGRLVNKEIDTNFDNAIDTWVWCTGAEVTRAERDRHHRGRPDQWESYERGRLLRVAYDDNRDGRPDRWENYRAGRPYQVQVDTNGDGQPDPQHNESIDEESAGPLDEPVSCDGTPVAGAAVADGGTPPTPPSPSTDADAGTPAAPAADPAAAPAATPAAGGAK